MAEQTSSLLRLSPELRNLIYECTLSPSSSCSSTPQTRQAPNFLSPPPSLTRTCRRIRQESLLLYYTLNTFHLDIPEDTAYTIAQSITKSHFAPTFSGNACIRSISLLQVTYHLSSMENMPASLGVGSKVQGGWLDLAEALARVGFEKQQVEWDVVSDRRFTHPALGGNYYVYLAEKARMRALRDAVRKDWEEALRRVGGGRPVED